MHDLVQTGLGNMQAGRHGRAACKACGLQGSARLVAPHNVVLDSMGQVAPPTLGINPICTGTGAHTPRVPRHCPTPCRRDATYTPRGVHKSSFKNDTESRQLYASCHRGRSMVRYGPTLLLSTVLLLCL